MLACMPGAYAEDTCECMSAAIPFREACANCAQKDASYGSLNWQKQELVIQFLLSCIADSSSKHHLLVAVLWWHWGRWLGWRSSTRCLLKLQWWVWLFSHLLIRWSWKRRRYMSLGRWQAFWDWRPVVSVPLVDKLDQIRLCWYKGSLWVFQWELICCHRALWWATTIRCLRFVISFG